jgi:hypothetical protein
MITSVWPIATIPIVVAAVRTFATLSVSLKFGAAALKNASTAT